MKREQLVWLLTATAGAAPLLEWGQGSLFDYPGVRFRTDGTFSITMFNDLHFGENLDTPERIGADRKTIKVMNTVLDNEQTDLVVLNGDLLSCEFLNGDNSTEINAIIDGILEPIIDRDYFFAATFGNHDMSHACNTRDMSEHMKVKGMRHGWHLSWTTSSVPGDSGQVGTSNYYIPLYSSNGGGSPELKAILWFFDSKGGNKYQQGDADDGVPSDSVVDEKVVAWFMATRDAINNDYGRAIPSIVFVHIPVHATLAFQAHLRQPSTAPGINEELIGAQGETSDYKGADEPFMRALVETEGLIAVFSGHDHGIDWCMKWSATTPIPDNEPGTGNGINLCFGRHTGYGGYSDWTRGGRQIVIDENKLDSKELETWIRLEDGTRSGHVMLNSTYGTDEYPIVSAKKDSFMTKPKPSVVAPIASSTTSTRPDSTVGSLDVDNPWNHNLDLKPKLQGGPRPRPRPQSKPKGQVKSDRPGRAAEEYE